MVLRIATTAISLALFFQCAEGVIAVNASYVHNDHAACCTYANCCCLSLHNASNVLINITSDVGLFLIIRLVNVANITITGHNNPNVNCTNSGGMHFLYLATIVQLKELSVKSDGSRNMKMFILFFICSILLT